MWLGSVRRFIAIAKTTALEILAEPLSLLVLSASLALAAPIVSGAELKRESIASRLDKGYLDATSFMEYLIRQGVPQRSAHGIVGRLVRKGIDSGRALAEMTLDELRSECDRIDERVYDYLGAANAVKAMKSYGSTAPDQVRAQIDSWKSLLGLKSASTNG